MSKGLSNYQIDDFFKDEENEDFKKKYMETYWIDSITRYINFYEVGVEWNFWWSFFDIQPKNYLFLLDLFSLEGFNIFIVDNDQQIINEQF